MSEGLEALTGREKEVLRLIARGHDAKSTARHLDLSVHTVNERLRFARRKMVVTSSREAARILHDREEAHPQNSRHEFSGGSRASGPDGRGRRAPPRRFAFIIAGAVLMSLILAGLLVLTSPPQALHAARADAAATPDTAVVDAARSWPSLVGDSRWDASWSATGSTFRRMNTVALWASASGTARVALGRALSRNLLGQEDLRVVPRDYRVLKFSTSFTNKPGAIETVALEREGAAWRVVGYVID